jgi:hypothetical protein
MVTRKRVDSWVVTDEFWERVEPLIEVPIEFRLPAGRSYTALDCWACCVAIQFSRNRTGEL